MIFLPLSTEYSPQPTEPTEPKEDITYIDHIRPIVEKSCFACHGEGSVMGNWLDYQASYEKREAIYERVVVQRTMPIGAPLSEEEVALFREWVDQGAKEGAAPTPVLSFEKDIKPIVQAKCLTCHGEYSTFGKWMNYDESFAKKDKIMQRVVVDKTMPLGAPLSEEEINIFKEWINGGAKK